MKIQSGHFVEVKKMVRESRDLAFALLTVLALPSASRSAQFYVFPDGAGTWPTIQSAVNAASSGDEVILGDGIYVGEGNRLVMIDGKVLYIHSSSGDPNACIIDCEGEFANGFQFSSTYEAGRSLLDGVTVTRSAYDLGGGVLAWYADVVISNCIFHNNQVEEGGGAALLHGNTFVENCIFSDNTSTIYPGGGLFVGFNSNVRVNGCTFVGNSATGFGPGGGIACWSSSRVDISRSIIVGSPQGEAVQCDASSTATISCSDIFNNAGGDWVSCAREFQYIAGNISADPFFCDPTQGNYFLRSDSPCAPASVGSCELIGARPVGCDVVSIEETSWGRIKAIYRAVP